MPAVLAADDEVDLDAAQFRPRDGRRGRDDGDRQAFESNASAKGRREAHRATIQLDLELMEGRRLHRPLQGGDHVVPICLGRLVTERDRDRIVVGLPSGIGDRKVAGMAVEGGFQEGGLNAGLLCDRALQPIHRLGAVRGSGSWAERCRERGHEHVAHSSGDTIGSSQGSRCRACAENQRRFIT